MTSVKKKVFRYLRILQIKNANKLKIVEKASIMNFTINSNVLQNIQKSYKTNKLVDLLIIKKDMMTIDVKI